MLSTVAAVTISEHICVKDFARMARGIWILSVALLAVSPLLVAGTGESMWWILAFGALTIAFSTVGLMLARRVPGNAIGWLFLVFGAMTAIAVVADAYSLRGLSPSTELPGATAAAVASSVIFGPLFGFALAALLVLFPSGRLPSNPWRRYIWAAVGFTALFTICQMLGPGTLNTPDPNQAVANPLAIPSAELIVNIGSAIGLFAGTFGVIVGAAVMQIRRFRQADGDLRQQLKWFGAAAIVNALVVASGPVLWNIGGAWGTVWGALFLIGLTTVPLATGVAILRYRLYEIDVIIRKTLVYTALAVTLGLLYLGGISLTTWLFRSLTGQSGALAVTLSTLVVAAAFQPLRNRIQRTVDHRFYRRKYDGTLALAAFNGRLREQIDLDALQTEVLTVVTDTLQPSHAELWLRPAESR